MGAANPLLAEHRREPASEAIKIGDDCHLIDARHG